jgi:SAM-dependent methyltransferase
MDPEFDRYAPTYSQLLRDPIRDRFAADSDFFHRRKWMVIRDFLVRHGVSLATSNWLDVGCGRGELLRLAGHEFARAVGCDPSSKMLDAFPTVEIFKQPSPAELPFPDQSLDLVTAVCVYHHVPSQQRASLTESIYRVLKPGGVFCLIEHNPWNPVTRLIVRRCPIDVDAELLTSSAASRLLRSSDLEIVETAYLLYFPERIFKRLARVEHWLRKCPMGGQFAMFCRRPSA